MPRRPLLARVSRGSILVLGLVLCGILAPGRALAAAVAVGTNGVSIASTTAGASWGSPVTINGSVSFAGVWMTSDANGIAVGNGNSIYRTANGGSSWSPVSPPITTTYNDVMFPTATTGWIAASNGQVLKTTNGGTNWTAQNTGAPGSLLGLHFVTDQQGCAVGTLGGIVRTTNGGTSWTVETTGSATLNDVFFFNATNGWAVGTGGTILRSTNGGDTWTTVSSGTTVDLTSVWFTSATLGFVCGGDRVVRRTTDGGTSWSAVTLPATNQQSGLFDVMFADPDTGIVVGSGVNAYRTVDGGTTWTVANPDPTGEILQAVHLSRPPGPAPTITVTVNALPAGRSFRVDGQTFTTTQVLTWDAGSTHTLEGVTPQSISAGERYVFSAWSGGSTSTSTSIQVSPTTNATFTANYQRQFFLTMSTETGGSVQPSSWQNAGASLQVSANDATGYDFAGWVGSGSGSYTGPNNPATITMNGPITQAANFAPVGITLTFQTSPSGRQVIVDGVTRTTPYVLQTTADVAHTLDVPSPQGELNGSRLAFNSWSDGGAKAHTIDPLVNTTYTASLKTQYFLTTLASPSLGGTLSPADGWHDAGSRVTLTASAALNFTFYLMVGEGPGSVSSFPADLVSVSMDGPITQTAYFSKSTMRSITVATSPPGPDLSIGTIDVGSSKTFLWPSGDALQLTAPSTQVAIANTKRWQFTSWSDGGLRTHTVTPTANTLYTARFDVQFALDLSAEAGGTTSPAPGITWADSNAVVPFTALPDSDHTFLQWSGTGTSAYSGGNNPASVTLRGKVAELARFSFLPRVTMGNPPGGPSFVGGIPDTIAWFTNFSGNVKLEYRVGPAGALQLITASTPNDGFFVWTPPNAPTNNLYLRVSEVTDGSPASQAGPFVLCDALLAAAPAATGLVLSTAPEDAAIADFNEDGLPDLALTGAAGFYVRFGSGASGFGDGSFGSVSSMNLVALVRAVAVADVNDDDRQDVVCALDDGRVSISRGNGTGAVGNGTFATPTFLAVGTSLRDVEAGDWNEDGRTDLVVADSTGQRLFFLAGNGADGVANGGFAAPVAIALGACPTVVRSADLDEDGILDLAVGTYGSNANDVILLRGGGTGAKGDGTFAPLSTVGTTGNVAELLVSDLDEDGIADLVYTNDADFSVRLALGQGTNGIGNGQFAPGIVLNGGNGPGALGDADFDRDGHVDLVVASKVAGSLRLLAATPGAAQPFTKRADYAVAVDRLTTVLVGDFLEDRRPDVFVGGTASSVQGALVFASDYSLCASDVSMSVMAPSAPGLTFGTGEEMTIAWDDLGIGRTGAVDVELSRDGGATWETVARRVHERSFSWTVTPPAAPTCRLRVSDVASALRTDLNDAPFAIAAAAVGVPGELALPTQPAFVAPWPNPGRGSTHFRLALPVAASPRVALYDVTGRRVRLLHDGALPAGEHALAWDGRNDAGQPVGAGIYFVRARWDGFQAERRVVRLD